MLLRSRQCTYLMWVLILQPVYQQSGQWNLFHEHHSVHTRLLVSVGCPRFSVTYEQVSCLLSGDAQITDPTLQNTEAAAVLDYGKKCQDKNTVILLTAPATNGRGIFIAFQLNIVLLCCGSVFHFCL